jgi:hypothetical protein
MADTRSTPTSPTPTSPILKADDPAVTTATGLSAADTGVSTGTATSGSGERSGGILKSGKDEALTEAKAMMRDAADEQRRRAAGAVGGIAGALHRAASNLEPENETIGRYTHLAAQRLDEVADYLRSSRLDDVLSGAEDLARRQPYWFVGGAMATGFLLARMVKSGASQRRLSGVERTSQRLAAASAAGYGTSTEAGTYPPGAATTSPISSAGAAGTTAPVGSTTRTEI